MKKFAAFLFWSAVFVAIVLVTDQFFVRFDPKLPVLSEVRAFYVDFRTRLLGLDPALPKLPDWSAAPAAAPAKKTEPPPAGRPEPGPQVTKPEASSPPAVKAQVKKAAPPESKSATPVAAKPAAKPPAPTATKPTVTTAAKPPASKPAASADGFVYADAKGELHFAATLDEVPPAFRSKAQPLVR